MQTKMLDVAEKRDRTYSYKIPTRRGRQSRKTTCREPELRSAEDAVTLKELLHFELNSYGEVRGHRLAVQLRRFILPVA